MMSSIGARFVQRARFQARAMSLKETLTNWTVKKTQDTQEKMFKEQMEFMSKQERFTFQVFYDTIAKQAKKSGATGWRSYMPGASGQVGVKETATLLKIMDSMTAGEREHMDALSKDEKARIALASAVEVSDVNLMMRQFATVQAIHGWVRREVALGHPLPENQGELQSAVARRPMERPANLNVKRRRR
ncbi:Signal recognition particle SRP54 subunit M-domain domain-containing protein [Plasmodiophora brassicae]|uniref:Signal recognition particle SRP54 subunit M-domain domain-containing protein n=1 Tax=Plasmodiophora brassicae TaxID=37360 RepID=A0A0G4J046_PLABS|nr:hypothetical protein PBRA_001700 [Plasmodiophora brassicae]